MLVVAKELVKLMETCECPMGWLQDCSKCQYYNFCADLFKAYEKAEEIVKNESSDIPHKFGGAQDDKN